MKPFLISILFALLLSAPVTAASSGENDKGDSLNTEHVERSVRKAIDRTVIFPVDARGKALYGKVDVQFSVNTDGSLDIKTIQTDHPELAQYVTRKLQDIRLNLQTEGEHLMRYRFVFRPQD